MLIDHESQESRFRILQEKQQLLPNLSQTRPSLRIILVANTLMKEVHQRIAESAEQQQSYGRY
jgi:vacuolar-type H+-ATPase subunit F/Vma7